VRGPQSIVSRSHNSNHGPTSLRLLARGRLLSLRRSAPRARCFSPAEGFVDLARAEAARPPGCSNGKHSAGSATPDGALSSAAGQASPGALAALPAFGATVYEQDLAGHQRILLAYAPGKESRDLLGLSRAAAEWRQQR
jgi:hypothetical protein